MPDGDRRKTIKLSKGGKSDAPPGKASDDSAAQTRKHDDTPPPPKPSGNGDQAKTQVFRGGSEGDAGKAEPAPAPSPKPEPSKSDADNKTRVYRPGAESGAPTQEAGESGMEMQKPQPHPQPGLATTPVVGWLVVVSGPGAGGYRAIFDGRNRIGRLDTADIPMDFGDTGISKEQAIIHYDPKDRKFLFIPQLDVENFTYVNQQKPTAPLELKALDEIEMAATTLRFVPLCGPKFDWSDLDKK